MSKDITMAIKMGPKSFQGLKDLAEGRSTDESDLLNLCSFIDERYDCADFRMMTVIRVLYDYRTLISESALKRLEETLINFKYWMDEPGEDSMCYWSENHQLLFFTCQYLAGQYGQDWQFKNSGKTGQAMMIKAKERLLRWMKHRFDYGFVEWHSNTYYEEDIAPLANLIDFAQDKEIVEKATMIMDLLLMDMAMHSYKGLFSVSSGRCYEEQKKNPLKQDTLEILEAIGGFGHVTAYDYSRITSNFHLMTKYRMPEIIKLIAREQSTAIIKTSMGLNLDEIRHELGNPMSIEEVGYYLWAMEAFTNPQSIKATMKMFKTFNMASNDFLKDLKVLSNPLMSPILPHISKVLNPATDGVAIQRANTYTYRTKGYMLSTAQNYHPGTFGDQQHIWQATLSQDVTVFTTHPAGAFFEDNARNFSPSYWVGSGILPHSVQDENVHISIYKVDQRKGFLEGKRQGYTHAYFPQDLMDEVILDGRYVFGRLDQVCIALIGRYPLAFNPKDPRDLIQSGEITYWLCELSENTENLRKFAEMIKKRDIEFKNLTLKYSSVKDHVLKYKGDYFVDGTKQDLNYKRLESPYGIVERKAGEIIFDYAGRSLKLDFSKQIREEVVR